MQLLRPTRPRMFQYCSHSRSAANRWVNSGVPTALSSRCRCCSVYDSNNFLWWSCFWYSDTSPLARVSPTKFFESLSTTLKIPMVYLVSFSVNRCARVTSCVLFDHLCKLLLLTLIFPVGIGIAIATTCQGSALLHYLLQAVWEREPSKGIHRCQGRPQPCRLVIHPQPQHRPRNRICQNTFSQQQGSTGPKHTQTTCQETRQECLSQCPMLEPGTTFCEIASQHTAIWNQKLRARVNSQDTTVTWPTKGGGIWITNVKHHLGNECEWSGQRMCTTT